LPYNVGIVRRVTDTLERNVPLTGRALCADVSQEHLEPLGATASRVDSWILVEYRRLWARDPIRSSGFSDDVKAHLRRQLGALPNSRLLFIRRPERREAPTLCVFYGRSLEADHVLHALEIDDYEQLLDVDFARGPADEAAGHAVEHPLFVVCTHGKRDRCCAKYGRPLYDELREQAEPDWVWQSTHVGGDRFAGNVVCLPRGLYFGRVERPQVRPLLDEYLAGRIQLEHYRGRSCHSFAVQAAERRVREETGYVGLDDLWLLAHERGDDGCWTVRFRVVPTGDVHEVEVSAEAAGDPTYLTCSAPTPQRPRRHVATAHRIAPPR
jgi:hypothetical protein